MKLREDFPKVFEMCSLEVPVGWRELVYELTEKIHEIEPTMKASQVKEKYGGLRYYTCGHGDEVDAIINEYEQKSFNVCDVCGGVGELRTTNGWWMTRCEEHK